jgi:hypothetical protein
MVRPGTGRQQEERKKLERILRRKVCDKRNQIGDTQPITLYKIKLYKLLKEEDKNELIHLLPDPKCNAAFSLISVANISTFCIHITVSSTGETNTCHVYLSKTS